MKTALVTPCFLEGKDLLGNDRLIRNRRYLEYYARIEKEIGFDQIFLFDNASTEDSIQKLGSSTIAANIDLLRFRERLERGPGPHDYPYCWRALYAIREIINLGFEKIISIDSDGFVLTKRLAEFIRKSDNGWVSFWCENGKHPESSLHILNRNAFPIFQNYTRTPWEDRVGVMMETDLPFTDVRQEFRCGRFGEIGAPPQDISMDYYGQALLKTPLQFEGNLSPYAH